MFCKPAENKNVQPTKLNWWVERRLSELNIHRFS
ncbi:MAG: hypothetical protein ACI8YI_001984, partial [Paracoccaceae bacterium]